MVLAAQFNDVSVFVEGVSLEQLAEMWNRGVEV
jgi:hypothetical protein